MTNRPSPQPQAETPPAASTGEAFAREVAAIALAKKAEDVVVLDLRGRHSLIDYFVICTASSRAAHVIGSEAYSFAKQRFGPAGMHLETSEEWVCADLNDVVLHVFTPQARQFYGLENLWGDAPRLSVSEPERAFAPR